MTPKSSKPPPIPPALSDRLLEQGTREHYEDAALYDLEYSDREDDVAWYVELAAELARETTPRGKNRPLEILELGAGTGRITLPLLAAGHRVTAVDRMPAMLDHLQRKIGDPKVRERLTIALGDMRAPPVAENSFDLVIAPFNALMHLYTGDDLRRCFVAAHQGLRDGGTFALDVLLPDLEWLTWDPTKRHAVTFFKHPTTGERLVYSTNHTYDPATQICHVRIFYDDARGLRRRSFRPPPVPRRLVHLAHRQIFPEELRALVACAGLHLDDLSGDFIGAPLTAGVESQVLRCRRLPRAQAR